AAAVVEAGRRAGPWLLLLAAGTFASLPLVVRARRAGAWRRLVVVVAALFIAWTAVFEAEIHPAIARERSLKEFFAIVGRTVPATGELYAVFPVDPGLRFYAPPSLRRWPDGGAAGGYLLLWEDEWRRLRDPSGRPLDVLAVSAVRPGRRGHLALVKAPRGALR
ncbi:MAG TPA: hypothetical protein VKA21_01735, partial [Candidatus Binatia bacterium]|nr:hypothetical protein [Candidatus Binatia bacterium]